MLKIAGSMIALMIGAWGAGLGPMALLAGLLAPLLVQMIYGAYVWFHASIAHPGNEKREPRYNGVG
jgi:hypothetical protein